MIKLLNLQLQKINKDNKISTNNTSSKALKLLTKIKSLNIVSPILIYFIYKKQSEIMKNAFCFTEKLLSFLKYSDFDTSFFPSFFHCPLLLNLLEKLIEDKS